MFIIKYIIYVMLMALYIFQLVHNFKHCDEVFQTLAFLEHKM